jgi:hypothetical protein
MENEVVMNCTTYRKPRKEKMIRKARLIWLRHTAKMEDNASYRR